MVDHMTTKESACVIAAKELTERIRGAADDLWELIVIAYQTRAWEALGYKNWDTYVSKELGDLKIRIPKEDRREIVGTLRDAGLSLRAIATATGYDPRTVTNDLRQSRPNLVPRPRQRTKTASHQPVGNLSKAVAAMTRMANELSKVDLSNELAGVGESALRDLQRARDALTAVIAKVEALMGS